MSPHRERARARQIRAELECDNARADVIRVALAMTCEDVAALPHHALRAAVAHMREECALLERMGCREVAEQRETGT